MPFTSPPNTRSPSVHARTPYDLSPVTPVGRRMPRASDAAVGANYAFAGPGSPRVGVVPLKSFVLILLSGVALFVVSARGDFLLGQLAAPMLTLGALHGLWRGGFRKIIMLAATIGLFYFATAGANAVDSLITSLTHSSSRGWNWVFIALAALLAMIFVSVLVKSVRKRFIMKHRFIRGFDRLLGVLVGMAEGALVILTVCWTVVEVRPYAQLVRDQQETDVGAFRHELAAQMIRLAGEAGTGDIGRFVAATNPIDGLPQLQQIIDDLNTRGQISIDSLGDLDPETTQRLNDLLKQTPVEDIGGLNKVIESYKQGNESRGRAYRQLPPQNDGRR